MYLYRLSDLTSEGARTQARQSGVLDGGPRACTVPDRPRQVCRAGGAEQSEFGSPDHGTCITTWTDALGAGMVFELPWKSRRGTDVLAAEGLFRRLSVLQRLLYGACVAVDGEPHPRCARCRCTHPDSSPPHHR